MKQWILFLLIVPALAWAQPQQSENFRITKSVLDAGGGASTSANFQLYSAFGQPTPVGYQTSANFGLWAGYLSPGAAVSPLSPIQALVIQEQRPSVKLAWPRMTGAASYRIYRALTADFTPGPGNFLAATTDTFYVDANVIPQPAVMYYYSVTSSSDPAAAAAQFPTDLRRDDSPADITKSVPTDSKLK